jgi:hypothetical protein
VGSFYLNTTYIGTDLPSVVGVVPGPALACADGDCVVVFREEDETTYQSSADRFTAALGCRALTVAVHDSDILAYEVHDAGRLVDQGAVPDPAAYFDVDEADTGLPAGSADGHALVSALGRGDGERSHAVLQRDYVFAEERHGDLVEALGLPASAVGWGYRYLQEGRDEFDGPTLTDIP